jgi:hypothetical protein
MAERQQRNSVLRRQRIHGDSCGRCERFQALTFDAAAGVEHEKNIEGHVPPRDALDFLDDAVVAQFEVVLAETGHRPAAACHLNVDLDPIHFDRNGWPLLLRGGADGGSRQDHRPEERHFGTSRRNCSIAPSTECHWPC